MVSRRDAERPRVKLAPSGPTMAKYLTSFPASAMDFSEADGAEVGEASHAVISDLQEVRRSAPTEGQDSALISGWHCRRIHPEHSPHVAVRVGEVPGVHEAMVLNRVHVGLPPVRRGGVVHRIDGVTAFHGQ
jgi:hypothetical protein